MEATCSAVGALLVTDPASPVVEAHVASCEACREARQMAEGLAATETARNADMRRQARDGAMALEPKLARLTIRVPKALSALAGLDVRRYGVPVGAVQWGVAVPVDRGEHQISVTATGKLRREKVIAIRADGESAVITLDPLEDLPRQAPPRPVI